MIYRLTVAYRGAAYAGWQRQENARTVQEVLEDALSGLLGVPAIVHGASRTDAGVHARGQVVHLETAAAFPERGLVHGTNHRLPADVRVLAAHLMPEPGTERFHARKSALGKEYVYRLSRAAVVSPLDALFVVPFPGRLTSQGIAEMRRAAGFLAGRHDFSAFALAGGSHGQPFRRIFSATWDETGGEELVFRVTGEGFLRGMVRALVGTLIEVGLGKRSPEAFADLLTGRPRGAAGPTAPPHGLVLERVFYPPPWRVQGDPELPVLL
jgi:tRNA pseudouridine38-40 synthase